MHKYPLTPLGEIIGNHISAATKSAWVDMRDLLTPFMTTDLNIAKLDLFLMQIVSNHISLDQNPRYQPIRSVENAIENMSVSVHSNADANTFTLRLEYFLSGAVALLVMVNLRMHHNKIFDFESACAFLSDSKEGLNGRTTYHIETSKGIHSSTVPSSTKKQPSDRKRPVRITVEGPSGSGKSMVLSVIARALSDFGVRGAKYNGYDEEPADFFAKAHGKDVAECLRFCMVEATELPVAYPAPGDNFMFLKERLEKERIDSIQLREHDRHKPVLRNTLAGLVSKNGVLNNFMTEVRAVPGLNWTHADSHGRIEGSSSQKPDYYSGVELIIVNNSNFVLAKTFSGEEVQRSFVSVKAEVRPMVTSGGAGPDIEYDIVHLEWALMDGSTHRQDFILNTDYVHFATSNHRVPNEVFDAKKFIDRLLLIS